MMLSFVCKLTDCPFPFNFKNMHDFGPHDMIMMMTVVDQLVYRIFYKCNELLELAIEQQWATMYT